MSGPELSVAAEFVMLAIDPAGGGIRQCEAHRFRKAVGAAYVLGGDGRRRWPWVAWHARRQAFRELERAGVTEGRRPFGAVRLADRETADRAMTRFRRSIAVNTLSSPRDQQLLLLFASSGLLGRVLSSRPERRAALRRARKLAAKYGGKPEKARQRGRKLVPAAHGAQAEPSADVWAFASFVSRLQLDLLTDTLIDSADGGDRGADLRYAIGYDGGGGGGDGGGGGGETASSQ